MVIAEEADPRPDITEDSAVWDRILRVAQEVPTPSGARGSLLGLLHGIRCAGTRTTWRDRSAGGRMLAFEYDADDLAPMTVKQLREEWLSPARAGIEEVLRRVEIELEGADGHG